VCVAGGLTGCGISVRYPGQSGGGPPFGDIAARGNVALLIGESVLAEIPMSDMDESWRSAARLGDAELAQFCQRAANRLQRAFDGEMASADLAEMVTNAAVLFVLSLNRHGVASPADLTPCTVTHDGALGPGAVKAAA